VKITNTHSFFVDRVDGSILMIEGQEIAKWNLSFELRPLMISQCEEREAAMVANNYRAMTIDWCKTNKVGYMVVMAPSFTKPEKAEFTGQVWVHESNCYEIGNVDISGGYMEYGDVGPANHALVGSPEGIWLMHELLRFAGCEVKEDKSMDADEWVKKYMEDFEYDEDADFSTLSIEQIEQNALNLCLCEPEDTMVLIEEIKRLRKLVNE
jgi:hypothetical protein